MKASFIYARERQRLPSPSSMFALDPASKRAFFEKVARLRLWRCETFGEGSRGLGQIYIRGAGRIRLGKRVLLDARRAPIELHAFDGAVIEIGDDVTIAGGTSIEAQSAVTIAARVSIGPYCKILDNHFHTVHGTRKVRPSSRPVVIGADVALGAHAIVLPGSDIGEGSVIHPGSVVSRRVFPGSELVGVPAMAVRGPGGR